MTAAYRDSGRKWSVWVRTGRFTSSIETVSSIRRRATPRNVDLISTDGSDRFIMSHVAFCLVDGLAAVPLHAYRSGVVSRVLVLLAT